MLIRHQTPSALCRRASVTHSHERGYVHSNHVPQRYFERCYYSVFIGYALPTVALKPQLKQACARQPWKVNHALGMREITKSNCKEMAPFARNPASPHRAKSPFIKPYQRLENSSQGTILPCACHLPIHTNKQQT